ncbi:MAG: hypothetical protein ABUL72_01035 [Armatimonadota bacterium]
MPGTFQVRAKRSKVLKEAETMQGGAAEPGKEPKQPEARPTFWLQIKNILNPKYHIAQTKEDISAFWHALKSLRRPMHEHDLERVDDLFRGRLMIGFYISGPFNFVALLLNTWLQYALNWQYSFMLLPIMANLLTGLVFQLVWAQVNRDVYSRLPKHGRFLQFEKDLLPVHWAALRYALTFWAVNLVALGFVVRILDLKNQAAAHGIPWQVVATGLELIFVTGPFVRNIGDFFERHAAVLAARYASIFEHGR